MPQNNLPEPGEFTRIFKRKHLGAQGGTADAEKNSGDASGIFPAAEATVEQHSAQSNALPTTPANPKADKASEPGEFTQFLNGKLAPKPATPAPRAPAGVQRPNSPISPPPQLQRPRDLATDGSGTFTELFAPRDSEPARRPSEYVARQPQVGPAPDLSRVPPVEHGDPFNSRPPEERAPEREAVSEYTERFGKRDIPPAPRPSAVRPSPAAPVLNDSPNAFEGGRSRPERMPQSTPAPQGPSEFTMIEKGRQPAISADGKTPLADAGAPATPAAGGGVRALPKIPGVSFNPSNPMAAVPHLGGGGAVPGVQAHAGMSGANVTTPVGSGGVHVPPVPPIPPINPAAGAAAAGASTSKLSDQTKLILFFGLLAILAVILVVIIVAKQKA